MRKFAKKIFFIATAMVLSVTTLLSACSDKSVKANGFALGHYDGSDTSNGYDTDLLYKNNSELWGGDSGIIWVSEEDGEKLKEKGVVDKNGESYGGYFYQYQSACGGVNSYGAIIDEPSGLGRGSTYLVTTRSPDLNDWEICGAVDSGMAVFVDQYEWLLGQTWAPECIQLPWDMKTPDGEPAPYAGKFMMYFCGSTKSWNSTLGSYGAIYGSSGGEFNLGSFMMAIAISDSPVGPFRLVNSENVYGDANAKRPVTKDYYGNDYYGFEDGVHELGVVTSYNPAVMFNLVTEDMTRSMTPIDCSPFIDDDGELYVAFVKQTSGEVTGSMYSGGNNCWVVRMTDPITPDYSSLRKVIQNGRRESGKGLTTSVVWKGDAAIAAGMSEEEALRKYPVWRDYPVYEDVTHANGNYEILEECSYEYVDTFYDGEKFESDMIGVNEGGCAEAPQIIKTKDKAGNTKYIMIYSPYGVSGNDRYDVKWAYSDNPLGPYMKPKIDDMFLLGYDMNTSYMTDMGHVQFLDLGDEIWFGHWEGDRPHTTNTNPGRIYACSQASWQYLEAYDIYAPIANGPSISVQALPQVATGYTNVAAKATVTATNAIGDTKKYLNDGMVVTMDERDGKEFAFKKSTVITLTFDEAVSVRGLFIYNAYDENYAFKNISTIQFTLAEKPDWYGGSSNGLNCYIDGLGFSPIWMEDLQKNVTAGIASVATFNEIKVSKIQIEINEALGFNEEIRISDIMVLGK